MWFNKNRKRAEEAARNKEAYFATKEVELYKREKMAEVDTLVAKYRASCLLESEKVVLDSAKKKGDYEHDYHSGIEQRRTELAQLDAEIDAKRDIIKGVVNNKEVYAEMQKQKALADSKDLVIAELKKQLERSDDNLKVVVGKLSKMEVTSLGLTVTAKESK